MPVLLQQKAIFGLHPLLTLVRSLGLTKNPPQPWTPLLKLQQTNVARPSTVGFVQRQRHHAGVHSVLTDGARQLRIDPTITSIRVVIRYIIYLQMLGCLHYGFHSQDIC